MSDEGGLKRRSSKAVSLFKRASLAGQSIRSRGSSVFLKFQKDLMGMHDDTTRFRDWIMVFTELLLSFSWTLFAEREKSEKTMEMRGITPRQDVIEYLFWLGVASIFNLVAGQVMDSFTGSYAMAVANVVMHFTLASLFLIVEIVHETASEDVYAHLLIHVFPLFPPIRALGFTRYVYAMDQLPGRGATFVFHYTFIYNFCNFLGSFLFHGTRRVSQSHVLLSAIAFSFNGTVLILFAYMLRPRLSFIANPPPQDVAFKVWGVLYTAVRNRKKFGKKIRRQDWLDYAENKYDKGQIIRTRRLFHVFLMALPTAGFILFTNNQEIILDEFYVNIKISGIGVPRAMDAIVAAIGGVILVSVEYILFPLLRILRKNINFMKRFVLGYMSLVLAVSMAAIISVGTQKLAITYGLGIMRIYNTMDGDITFNSTQHGYEHLDFVVTHKTSHLLYLEADDEILFRMDVNFSTLALGDDITGNVTHYTQHYTISPLEVVQYIIIQPSTIIRVPQFLPMKESEPGKNDRGKPRCFVVSLIGKQTLSVYVVNQQTEQKTQLDVEPGRMVQFQVEEGDYVLQYTFSVKKQATAKFEVGGLYGIYLYLGPNEFEIDVDTILKGNTNHPLIMLVVSVPMLIARGIGQVALDAFIYSSAPEGLKGLAFGFYMFCSQSTAWFILIGFSTWHRYITPVIIVYYATFALVSFFLCLIIIIRFQHYYTL